MKLNRDAQLSRATPAGRECRVQRDWQSGTSGRCPSAAQTMIPVASQSGLAHHYQDSRNVPASVLLVLGQACHLPVNPLEIAAVAGELDLNLQRR